MKFSYNWLQTYFEEPLPAPELLAEQITFHSSEVEEVVTLPTDTVLEVKVLPDKSAWLLSHRGLAKEISAILNCPVVADPLQEAEQISSFGDALSLQIDSPVCDYYAAAYITGVTVQKSPAWLEERLTAIGQRPINALVDATNYVMFALGQPLHAFDADKLTPSGTGRSIGVRQAREGEEMTTLLGEVCALTPLDTIIVDGVSDVPLGIAGVKGGQVAAVSMDTTAIILEAAHFDRFAVRTTAKRLKLPTDAAKRYENGLSRAVAPAAFTAALKLIAEVAGGKVSAIKVAGRETVERTPVPVAFSHVNSVLGLELSPLQIESIIQRFGYQYEIISDTIVVTPPFERDDILIAEDLIEEVGRMHGLDAIVAIPPTPTPVRQYNARQYYAEEIRSALVHLGFSEVYTSSFRAKDTVRLENALASDKGYLRSSLVENLREARSANTTHRDLLGIAAVQLFEIGTVFAPDTEEFRVALAVQTGTVYKSAVDDSLLTEALTAVAAVLGKKPTLLYERDGIAEFSLDALLPELPAVVGYNAVTSTPVVPYQAFSVYPASSRDIAFWVPESVTPSEAEAVLRASAGDLCVRITHLDTFTKEGRTSYAYRLVLQSKTTTLTDELISGVMDSVYLRVAKQGWDVR